MTAGPSIPKPVQEPALNRVGKNNGFESFIHPSPSSLLLQVQDVHVVIRLASSDVRVSVDASVGRTGAALLGLLIVVAGAGVFLADGLDAALFMG